MRVAAARGNRVSSCTACNKVCVNPARFCVRQCLAACLTTVQLTTVTQVTDDALSDQELADSKKALWRARGASHDGQHLDRSASFDQK